MASSTKSPGTLASVAGPGAAAWSNPSNAAALDGSSATSSLAAEGDNDTEFLRATNFGFSIPSGATIDGIVVRIWKDAGTVVDSIGGVRLIKAGVVSGDDKSDIGTQWSGAYATHGGVADLWGLVLTPADVNASNFGVVVAAGLDGALGAPGVDHIEIEVTYTETVRSTAYLLMMMGSG